MKPLVDSDILAYEIGFAAEAPFKEEGTIPPFSYVEELLEMRINNILGAVGATEPATFYFTGKNNFRYHIAKRQPYKDRPSLKPWHYKNIKAHMMCVYDCIVSDGLEADDLMSIGQTKGLKEGYDTIICTRDKDLFSVPGNIYSWELGNQPSRGPLTVTELGDLQYTGSSLKGTGGLFFYAQCLMGDTVDSIPGCSGIGKKKSFDILFNCECLEDAYNRVLEQYVKTYGDKGEEYLTEQARLLHMVREVQDRMILMWSPPKSDYEDWYDIDTKKIERVIKL